ncbi:hypothetical protein FCL47_04685 [Desulfopila sp. IMCC35006]|uniref:hypothetical protein n=1 Tax=Desulfopila sp. IMCC35006 TaxID=2569542 RepID=UPI0010AC9F1C|nr:hypothetical protein [Desulfopila sp. IMCC35006]TKB27439.1 hypothetical protein FCL47_04685 [Desulfopila sp. IMCC35006]
MVFKTSIPLFTSRFYPCWSCHFLPGVAGIAALKHPRTISFTGRKNCQKTAKPPGDGFTASRATNGPLPGSAAEHEGQSDFIITVYSIAVEINHPSSLTGRRRSLALPANLQGVQTSFDIDLQRFNANDCWVPPGCDWFIVDTDGVIKNTEGHADQTRRPEPGELVDFSQSIAAQIWLRPIGSVAA